MMMICYYQIDDDDDDDNPQVEAWALEFDLLLGDPAGLQVILKDLLQLWQLSTCAFQPRKFS